MTGDDGRDLGHGGETAYPPTSPPDQRMRPPWPRLTAIFALFAVFGPIIGAVVLFVFLPLIKFETPEVGTLVGNPQVLIKSGYLFGGAPALVAGAVYSYRIWHGRKMHWAQCVPIGLTAAIAGALLQTVLVALLGNNGTGPAGFAGVLWTYAYLWMVFALFYILPSIVACLGVYLMIIGLRVIPGRPSQRMEPSNG